MDAVQLTTKLVSFDSVSSESNIPVAEFLRDQLACLGLEIETVAYTDERGVGKLNLVGKRGKGVGGLGYFAHNDVVPAEGWAGPDKSPFHACVVDDLIYGRGSCDMKGSIAVMLNAIARIDVTSQSAPLYFVCTADEEVGFLGAKCVVRKSALYREMVAGDTRALIGEPTELRVVYGHKGICGFRVTSRGKAAHSSTREGVNANLAMIPFLAEMKRIYEFTERESQWHHPEFDPPTVSWNIGINDYTTASNITPAKSECTVCFRPMPGQEENELLSLARKAAEQNGLEFSVESQGRPFLTDPNAPFVQDAASIVGSQARTVAFGTDGGEFHELKQMIVCGPGSIQQAHTNDEWISLDQIQQGVNLYEKMIRRWCCG